MKQESKGNDKLKEWRKVKIIENKHICKTLVLHNLQFTIQYFAQCFSVFINEFGQVNTVWKGQVKWKTCVFFIFNLLVPLFRPSLFRVVLFFYISIYGSSQRRCSVKKGVRKNFPNFTGKHLCWSLFLLKRDSNTGIFLWNLRSF